MYRILNYTRIKPRSRPPQKKKKISIFYAPRFSAAKIGKKVHKLCKQIRYTSYHITSEHAEHNTP